MGISEFNRVDQIVMAKKEPVNIRTQIIFMFLPILSWYAFYRIEKIWALLGCSVIGAVLIFAITGVTLGAFIFAYPGVAIIVFIIWAFVMRDWSKQWNENIAKMNQDN